MQSREQSFYEAERITWYLLRTSAAEEEKQAYADAMQKLGLQFSGFEAALFANMMKSRRRMALIDAGLAFRDPLNPARRKLFTMLAILEASPNYTSFFLSQDQSFFYLFRVGWAGCRAVLKALAGVIIVNNIRYKCS
jgi:hypothetical protein